MAVSRARMMRSVVTFTPLRQFSRGVLLREIEYDYDKIHRISQSLPASEVLIDVREPHEFEAGNIPSSRNVPLSNFEQTFKLEPSEFQNSTGFPKPGKDEPVIFYCKAGVRSTSASRVAEALGYSKVGNYKGSWNDYTSKQTAGVGSQGGRRAFSTSRVVLAGNPNERDGSGEGAAGGIDLKKMNQKEEKRAEGQKQKEKKGEKLASAGEKESESVRSGAELSDNKKFE